MEMDHLRESPTSPRLIAAAERQAQAVQLRRAGADYQEIANKLGYANPQGAWSAVQAALKRAVAEPAAEVRQLELERVDRLFLAVWPRALRGDLEAVDRVLKIMKRRSELLGLDAPKNVNLSGSIQLDWNVLISGISEKDLEDPIAKELARLQSIPTPARNDVIDQEQSNGQ